ncbi:MAG TPA: CHRD domain-containing protein [Bryobacteraceae bacterium]|nr:CHRD domain-containing protein [Bryobacteraceae bacterium]
MNFFRRSAHTRLVLAGAALLALIGGATAVRAQDRPRQSTLTAIMTPLNQVPAVLAPGRGTFIAHINADGTISFTLAYSNMTSAVTQAHIHFGAIGTNGGVMVFLCGGPKPACPASGEITGTLSPADVSVLPASNSDSVIPQGIRPSDLDAMVRAIRSGNAYVNVHTANFPKGEIRGQVEVY